MNMVSQFVSSHPVKLLGDLEFNFPEETHAIGRLDQNSEGLLLLTTNKKVTRLLFQGLVPHTRTYLVQVKNTVSAVKYLSFIASKAPNKFATDAVLHLARAYYFELRDYTKATSYYKQLDAMAIDEAIKKEAVRGLIRSATKQSNWEDALPAAMQILEMSGAASDDKVMANFVMAKSKQLSVSLDTAVIYYKEVIASGKSEFSAEAKYTTC